MQRTYMAKNETVDRDWWVVDADGVPLGRLASRVAHVLRGKHKPVFTPHVDTGDHVVVINAARIRLTGKKTTDKMHYRHSGYPGGLRAVPYGKLLAEQPESVVTEAVRRMLPKNRLGRKMLKKLHVSEGPVHPHAAQNPSVLDAERLGL